MRLYELSSEFRRLASLADDDAPEEELQTALTAIGGELNAKAGNVAAVISEIEESAAAIRAGEKRMADRRRSLENQALRIREYLLSNMLAAGVHSVSSPYLKIAVRETPPSVVIDDETVIPAEYMRLPPAVPDKVKIIADLKEGVVIEGCHAERGKRLHIS